MTLRQISLVCLLCLVCLHPQRMQAQADSARYRLQLSAGALCGYLYPHSEYVSALTTGKKMTFGGLAAIGWKGNAEQANESDILFGLPTIETGVLVMDYAGVALHNTGPNTRFPGRKPSDAGQMIVPYGAVSRPLAYGKRAEFGYRMSQGIGFSTRPYSYPDNPENELIGAPLSIFVGLGFYGKIRLLDHWQLGLVAEMHHFSNGRLDMPNLGINSFEAGAQLIYSFDERGMRSCSPRIKEIKDSLKRNHKKHFYADVNVAWLPRVLNAEHQYNFFHRHPDDPRYRSGRYALHSCATVNVAWMYRYSPKFASGIGFEYIYAPIGGDIQYWENLRGLDTKYASPHGCSIRMQHEAFYKNIGVNVSIGCYLKKEPQHDNDHILPIYETAGIRYYLPVDKRRLYLGYNIRARAFTADCFQFALGYAIGK